MQYDVYPNPSPRMRDEYPYVVDIQSRWFEQLPTRLVVPLLSLNSSVRARQYLSPVLMIEDQQVLFVPWQIQTIPVVALGQPFTSLADDDLGNQIINAIHLVISRAYQ